MYSSRGSNPYPQQQSYAGQSSYGQNPASAYSGSSVGAESGSQFNIASRHPSMLASRHESDIGGYRAPSSASHHGGQYSSLYGSSSLSTAQQVSAIGAKPARPSALEGRSIYISARPQSPKYQSDDYIASSSLGYGHKTERSLVEKISEYPSLERRPYGERQSSYIGRDLPPETAGRYADSISYSQQRQPDIYGRIDQSVLRQEQMLKNQPVHPASHEGVVRQAEYIAARTGTLRQIAQELEPYGGRVDADTRGLSLGGRPSFGGQNAPSILGAAPQRNVEDLIYSQTSSNPGYGVSLPPGRDYGAGKGLNGSTHELEYPGSITSRGLHLRVDDRKVERGRYARELELREDERQRERLHEREKEREKERERERDRDRERERERERERDRECERKRILELREERDRLRKRGLELRQEKTPPRLSKDRHPSLTKDGKSIHRDSPRHEALHRLRSPVREKRREYVCKVYASSLVVLERDYLSLDRRYPRLYISPDFCKLIVNWPKSEMKISLHTPVSFEHDFVEEEDRTEHEHSDESMKLISMQTAKHKIVWNAKMVLMSGLSRSALEELSLDKFFDDRIPHICSFLRFAVLRKERSFMAIGGPWDPVDGEDPAVDSSSLVRTVIRHAKEVTQLDLHNCQHWNRFLEIHYDRVGKDGLFSHKEVTVLFVPDLSNCLPSLDAWREQWLSHKKAVAERERQLSLKREKLGERKDSPKDGEVISLKDGKKSDKSEKKKESQVNVKKEKDDGNLDVQSSNLVEDGTCTDGSGVKIAEKKGEGDSTNQDSVKHGKKKIVRRIIKQKVTGKSPTVEDEKDNDKDSDPIAKGIPPESAVEKDKPTEPDGVKTFVRRKVLKKIVQASSQDKSLVSDSKDSVEDKSQVQSGATGISPVKRTVKRKIIKRVPKKKAPGATANSRATGSKSNGINEEKEPSAGNETENMKELVDGDMKAIGMDKFEKDLIAETLPVEGTGENQGSRLSSSEIVNKDDKVVKKEERTNVKEASDQMSDAVAGEGTVSLKDNREDSKEKVKERGTSIDLKVEKEKDVKDGVSKSGRELDRKKSEEPPRPGLIFSTKASKDSKLRSLSLSLDSLLDYSDKDVEESTFELSLFAEAMYEMLQYQMGSRLLIFLQKLRMKFLTKRNRRKRQREEDTEKKPQDETSTKLLRSGDETPDETKSTKSEEKADTRTEMIKTEVKEEKMEVETENEKIEEATEKPKVEDEDEIEEDPEEDEEMQDGSSENEEESSEEETTEANPKPEEVGQDDGKGTQDELAEGKDSEKDLDTKASADVESMANNDGEKAIKDREEVKVDASENAAPAPSRMEAGVDKELLQAFRFFDRNRAGYIRVEDMRLILHNLGKHLSHRDVKELAQSALLESNTGRDNRILYEKLVKVAGLPLTVDSR